MAFYVAQLRKESDKQQTYMTSVLEEMEAVTILSPNPFQSATEVSVNPYTDFALSGTFQMGQVYYLRFKIHKIPQYYYSGDGIVKSSTHSFSQADLLNIRLLLKKDNQTDEENNPPEQVGSFTVPQALSNESDAYASYSFIFTPSKTFNRLVFRIVRTGYDELIQPRNWLIEQIPLGDFNTEETVSKTVIDQAGNSIIVSVKGIRINCGWQKKRDDKIIESSEDGDVCILKNIIPSNINYWIKLGYQSRPGNLIVVNGEPIRVGRSGIYELNNGTKIESFMIASPNGSDNKKIDAFLLDYAYTNLKS